MKRLIRMALNCVPRRWIQRVAHIAAPVLGVAYLGRGVTCPVCGRRYRRFMPYGYVHSRENALCPGCLSLERHRLMWLYIERETDLLSPATPVSSLSPATSPAAPAAPPDTATSLPLKTPHPHLLHIAPERCFIKIFKKALGGRYVTADLESPLADVKMDVQAIPFPDGEFDVVFCNHILEHVEDDRLAMRELFRVMRPGGWGIMLSPVTRGLSVTREDPSITTPEGRAEAFGQHDHLREYGEDYPARLAEAGFRVEAREYLDELPDELRKQYDLRPETIYVVRKP